jgi:hypothetical protein
LRGDSERGRDHGSVAGGSEPLPVLGLESGLKGEVG